MRILVTGGTGFIGKRLVKKLSDNKNNKIIVFSRHEDEELKNFGIAFVTGSILDKEELRKAFPVDIVYHLAADIDESDPLMYQINVDGTKNVVSLSKEYGVKGIILMSSCGVLGDTNTAKEDGQYNPKTTYEKSKAESEKLIIDSGISYSIVRAPVILGPNEIWLKITEAAKNRYPVIGSGKNHFHLAYVDDVVSLLLVVKDSNSALNQIFHVATKDVPTYEEVYRTICDLLGIEMTGKHLSVFFIKLLSSMHTLSCKIRKKKPKLIMMKSSINRLIRDRTVSIEKARTMLGFEPQYDTQTSLKETIEYFKQNNML